MNIYISGISGTGMGPLALMAKQAGMKVCGSDLVKGAVYNELTSAGIEVCIGEQDGEFLKRRFRDGVDWFVHTSALPKDHAELRIAHDLGIKCTKRDDFTAFLVEKLGLKMVAVAGTHGKTTTTAMIVWGALKMNLPIAYIVGTTLGFAPSGAYSPGDEFFVYEADEYDKNFLKYNPWLAVIPAVSYDHLDIYPTREDYLAAFEQFKMQSENILQYDDRKIVFNGKVECFTYRPNDFSLAGEARRVDAALAASAILRMRKDINNKNEATKQDLFDIVSILNEFPGVGRRFEKIANGIYTDYAHHPEEIAATLGIAKEECKATKRKGVVVVYQPHQNTRQHEVRDGYADAFSEADKIYWLPTYLTRENPDLSVFTPEELIDGLNNKEVAEVAELGDKLAEDLRQCVSDGYLVILMTAGPADRWLRENFVNN